MKRFVIDVDEKLHNEIKARAAIRGYSLRKYLLHLIIEGIVKEKSYE